MTTGIPYSDQATGETGYLWPVGWTPQIVPKRKFMTTPDLDVQARKAEALDGGRRGHIVVQGLRIAIENPAGSTRSGVDPTGAAWSVTMAHHYGFCERTVGADGDGVDCFVGPDPASDRVFIINQNDPTSGEFDEHKVMLGWNSPEAARAAYHANYSAGWDGFDSLVEHTMDDFKDWLTDETATRSLAKAHGEYPPLQPGDHFISMGHGVEKHTFLIHMVPGSNHVARVIGGGGGKLNGLRLNKLDPAKWKEKSKASAKTRRDAEARERWPEQRESFRQRLRAEEDRLMVQSMALAHVEARIATFTTALKGVAMINARLQNDGLCATELSRLAMALRLFQEVSENAIEAAPGPFG